MRSNLAEHGFVLDGEFAIPGGTFEMLQLCLHPAQSRIDNLSEALFMIAGMKRARWNAGPYDKG